MPIRTNGGVFTDQMLTGSLKHFTIGGADFSGAADANNFPIHNSAAEIIYTDISQRATIVIMNPITNMSGMSFALETNRADWTAAEIQTLVRSLGTIGVDDVDVSGVIVNESRYDLLESGSGGATTFIDLVDTPADYTGSSGLTVHVNSTESGLEFLADGGAPPVLSVFSRTGVIVAQSNDYNAGQIFYSNTLTSIASTDVQDAIDNTIGRVVTLENAGFLTDITAQSIGDLSDVNITGITTGQVLVWSGAGFIVADKSPGDFVGLTDTPADYTGQANRLVSVKSGEDGLEFVDNIAGTITFVQLSDTPANYAGQADKIVTVKAGEDGLEFIDNEAGSRSYIPVAVNIAGIINSKYLITSNSVTISLPLLSSVSTGDVITVGKLAAVPSGVILATGSDQISSDVGTDTSVSLDLTQDVDFVAGTVTWELLYGGL